MPHPLENLVELKVQTDGSLDPKTAVKRAIDKRVKEVDELTKIFKKAVDNYKTQSSHMY